MLPLEEVAVPICGLLVHPSYQAFSVLGSRGFEVKRHFPWGRMKQGPASSDLPNSDVGCLVSRCTNVRCHNVCAPMPKANQMPRYASTSSSSLPSRTRRASSGKPPTW